MVLETYGGLGEQALEVVRTLGKALVAASDDMNEDQATNYLGTKLSFLCQQGLARSLNARYTTLHLHNMFDGMQTGMEGDDRDDDVGMVDVGPGQRDAGAGGIG